MEQKLILFIKKMWSETIAPTLQAFATKNKENTDRIIKALEDKEDIEEISINNTEDIVNPLLEAQNATTQAIKDLPRVEIPETDLKGLESKIEALQKTLENKKLEVNIGETRLELKPVIEAIKKIKLEVPKMEKQEVIDYTMMFSEMMNIMERPVDHTHMIEMKAIMEKCARTEDIAILAEYLQNLIDKPNPEFPELAFTKERRLKVEVDRVGGGGGMGLTSAESTALQGVATEDTQQSVLAAIQGLGGSTAPIEVLAESFTLTKGSVTSGTYQDTHLAGGIYHTIAESAVNGFDVYYEFDVPDGFTADHTEFVGRYQGSASHDVNVYAYNWTTTVWDKISSPANKLNHATTDYTKQFDIIAAHTSTQGKIRIRILHETATYNASHRLYVDHIDVYFIAAGATRLLNKNSEIVNPASQDRQNTLSDYQLLDIEEASATVTYFGKAKPDGTYLIIKEDSTSNFTRRSANIGNNPSYTTYAAAYAARASLSYDYIFNLINL